MKEYYKEMKKEIMGWNSKTPEKWKYKTHDKTKKWRKRTAKEYQNPLTSSSLFLLVFGLILSENWASPSIFIIRYWGVCVLFGLLLYVFNFDRANSCFLLILIFIIWQQGFIHGNVRLLVIVQIMILVSLVCHFTFLRIVSF